MESKKSLIIESKVSQLQSYMSGYGIDVVNEVKINNGTVILTVLCTTAILLYAIHAFADTPITIQLPNSNISITKGVSVAA